MNPNVISFELARRNRQELALERISDSYLMIDETTKAIEILELILELRVEFEPAQKIAREEGLGAAR